MTIRQMTDAATIMWVFTALFFIAAVVLFFVFKIKNTVKILLGVNFNVKDRTSGKQYTGKLDDKKLQSRRLYKDKGTGKFGNSGSMTGTGKMKNAEAALTAAPMSSKPSNNTEVLANEVNTAILSEDMSTQILNEENATEVLAEKKKMASAKAIIDIVCVNTDETI